MNARNLLSITTVTPATPQDLAAVWCSMDADEQAAFFNTIGQLSKTWSGSLCMQMQYIADSEMLTIDGRNVIETFGAYA